MSIFSYLGKHAVISTVVGLLIIVVAVIGGRAATTKAPVAADQSVKRVTLVNAASFRNNDIAVSANGVVESYSQADLRSQLAAPVSVIDVAIGGHVATGQVILELQNNDIRAQLAQAQASLLLAQGQFSTGSVSLDSAKQTAIDKIRNAYTQTYNAIVSQVDPVLYNNDGNGGRLVSYTNDSILLTEITNTDIDLKASFVEWNKNIVALNAATSTDSIQAAIALSQKRMTQADLLFNDISKVLNGIATYSSPSFTASVNGWKATIAAAQASVVGAEQALLGAETSLNVANSSQGSSVPAQVSVAQAGVDNLEAQLAKTILRSPISGTVSALPLHEGELASPGTLLATVVGSAAGLKIKAYVSGMDVAQIQIGTQVTLQNNTKGTVSNLAPSVDATTKQAEVDIAITDPSHSGLVIGQNITVSIPLTHVGGTAQSGAMGQGTSTGQTGNIYNLPIQDIKITSDAAYVFTVDVNSKIVRNNVTLGATNGDFIQVIGGLTDDMNIVSPVYELDEGQTVLAQ